MPITTTRRGGAADGVSKATESNEKDELLVAEGLPRYTEMARRGQGYQVIATSAVAALVVRPGVTSGVEIWNGYGAGGPSLIIDRAFTHNLVSSTTGLGGGAGIWLMVTKPVATAIASTLTPVGTNGKAYGGPVRVAVGTTVVDNGWYPWGPTRMRESAGSVVPAGILTAEISGRIIVPPLSSLCIQVVSGYTADTFCSGAMWYEEQLTVE
jgi:hypothetical protein